MVVDGLGIVDRARLQPVVVRHLPGDVGVLHVHERLRHAPDVKAVRAVVAADDHTAAARVVLAFEGGDLAGDQDVGRVATQWRGRDLHLRPDLELGLREHLPVRVAEPDLEHVGGVQVVVNDHVLQQDLEFGGQGCAVDLDPRAKRELLGHLWLRPSLSPRRRLEAEVEFRA